jgi:hypothetical protein
MIWKELKMPFDSNRNRQEHAGGASPAAEESERFAGMTAEKKIQLAIELYWAARELMAAGLRARKPNWTEEKIRDEVRKAFLYGSG